MYSFDNDQVTAAMEKAVEKCEHPNKEGQKLQTEFTYKRTVDEILKTIGT
jgi:hypothetical protein